MVSTGLAGAGYRYVNIDDCWMERERDPSTGQIVPSKRRFPSGMKALGDYLHSKKLLFGIYSSSGDTTCEGLPGSWGHEEQDARCGGLIHPRQHGRCLHLVLTSLCAARILSLVP